MCSNWSLPSPQHSSKPALSSLSLLFSNCRSLMHQMDELQVLVANASPPTIIALAETWLDNTILPCELAIPFYNLHHRDRDRHGGGVAIYIHDSLPVCSVYSHPTEEMLSVEIDTASGCLLVCVIYRPPGHDKGLQDLELSLVSLKTAKYRHVLLVGDFNVDTSNISSCGSLDLLSTLSGFGLCHLPTDHTRISPTSASTIDLLFTNDPALVEHLRVMPGLGTSDHCSLFCSLAIRKPRQHTITRRVWLYQRANFDNLNDALENCLPPEEVMAGGDVNSTWPLFRTAFWDCVRQYIPSKLVRLKGSKPSWYTGEVWQALRKRDVARKAAKRLRSPAAWRKFRALRNRAVNAIRRAKRSYFSYLCDPSTNCQDEFWRAYRKLSTTTTRMPATLVCGSESASTAGSKARMLNDYFVSCFSLGSDLRSTMLEGPPSSGADSGLSFFHCDASDVIAAICNMKIHTSSGPDDISARMLKGCAGSISSKLSCIFNASFISGTVPSDWKVSRVTPIYKKGDASLASNYRPISLLPLVAKLQERIVHVALQDHLLSQKAISPSQFGFRPHSSTQEALVHMTQLWHQHLEDGGSSLCVFLDLAKAFDTVPHQGVISAVAKACVSGPALKWIADYLSGRRQFVVLEGASSSLASVTLGVPQGSILGPLLFLTTFDGIFRLPLSASSEITGYADDTTYSKKLRDDSDVKSAVADLDTINHWIASSGFKLSVPKVKMMVISRKRHPPTPTIVIKGHQVEQVSSFKLLGVTISADLSWRQHIHGIVSKAKCLLGFLYRVFGSSNRRCLSILYRSAVLPHLDYCSSVWDPPHKTHIQALERVQTFAARLVTNDWAGNGESLRALLGWPKLSTRRQFQKLCLCRRIVTGGSLIPPCFFEPHPRPTSSHRNSSPLFRPYVRTLQHRHSFKHSVVDVWNGIPEGTVSSSQTVRSFKAKLRELLFT